ncbi:MAG: aminotransferase class I/II-fold pyridoxal phosphate-dependent enzyme [Ruminococcaceae bacterium]|nr:aminotransferase class I/II-fold pyridoxal phosphate-dependent enzyme [Oscillospiraceae bacterium]
MYRLGQEEKDAVARVIDAKTFFKVNNGLKETEKAETELKEKVGAKHAILMTSGKAALISALAALGIGPGDQVIVPAYTYIATALAVVAVGAIPVIAECDETLTLDPVDTEKKITPYTKAIMPVHIQGFPCNMDALCALAKKYNLKIVEDACQADGGSYKGRRLGTIGDAGAYSFNQMKVISCGEGGAFLTNEDVLFQRALIYHDASAVAFFGNQMESFSEPMFAGVEYRTNELNSAVLRVQISRLDGILTDLRRIKKRVIDACKDVRTFIPSNDPDGDLGITLAMRFDTKEEAKAFSDRVSFGNTIPIDTGKHIYTNWTAIMEKRGSIHPLMDPFKMEANRDIIPDYKPDMCPKTLDLLERTVYTGLHPDMSDVEVENLIREIRG